MKKTLVLGIGNRLMMDDGIGIYVVEELQRQNYNSNLTYVIGETDINYCLGQINDTEFLVIIDAVRAGKEPGEITVIPLDKITGQQYPGYSCHNFHLIDLLGHNKALKGVLIGIEAFEINYSTGLSKVLAASFPAIIDRVKSLLSLFHPPGKYGL